MICQSDANYTQFMFPNYDTLLSLKSATTFTRAFQSQKDENW